MGSNPAGDIPFSGQIEKPQKTAKKMAVFIPESIIIPPVLTKDFDKVCDIWHGSCRVDRSPQAVKKPPHTVIRHNALWARMYIPEGLRPKFQGKNLFLEKVGPWPVPYTAALAASFAYVAVWKKQIEEARKAPDWIERWTKEWTPWFDDLPLSEQIEITKGYKEPPFPKSKGLALEMMTNDQLKHLVRSFLASM